MFLGDIYMMDFLFEYGLFLAKAVTLAVVIIFVVGMIFSMARKNKDKVKEHVELKNYNEKYKSIRHALEQEILDKKEYKQLLRKEKKSEKKSLTESGNKKRKKVFILNFKGDIKASAVGSLREEITAILMVCSPEDEVILKLESSGGTVHGYGLAASQLKRLKSKNIPLIVSVDKVAASGGYLMASIADKITAAPFAIIGSIGVIAQIPNFHRLLKKRDIDFEQITAGEYKRTLTVFGENTESARNKLSEQIEDTHKLFKDFIKDTRKEIDIEKVSTGEYWYGTKALELNLIDEITTSDDLIFSRSQSADILEVSYKYKKNVMDKIFSSMETSIQKLFETALNLAGKPVNHE